MVDNIKLNRISPLLSSAERVKRVDRRQREGQQPPFKGALKDEDRKKKKKKKDIDGTLTGNISARGSREPTEKEKEPASEQPKKIIDIRV
jgi:hypothetical protein